MIISNDHSHPDSADTLWYDPEVNRFENECGYIMHNLSEFFDVWQLDKWKKTKQNALLIDKTGGAWEVFYNDKGVLGRCHHQCMACLVKCDIYWLLID